MQAFDMLNKCIAQVPKNKKHIVFLDELPWLATRRSGLLEALEHYWNNQWVDLKNFHLIVCGSAASWIIENIINNQGGLHNRVTKIIRLEPFTLAETREFLAYKKVRLDQNQIVQLYMAIGGIPLYLDHVEKGLSATENIDHICFNRNGLLFSEFNNLFASLFHHAEAHEELIQIISQHRNGIALAEIVKQSKKISSGGTLQSKLNELEEAGFIISFIPYGHKQRGIYYKIIDEYTLFYLRWIKPTATTLRKRTQSTGYWAAKTTTPAWKTWAGLAFEALCYKHIDNIRQALHISPGAEVGAWRYTTKKKEVNGGAQIDLLFDREDGVITLCEIKYSSTPFAINKACYQNLLNKINVYKRESRTNKQIFIVFIAAHGLQKTIYSEEIVTQCITIDDLF
jgi:hypothetical protein